MYLYQKEYDNITNMFIDKLIDKEEYCKAIEFYEDEFIQKLYTVNLN